MTNYLDRITTNPTFLKRRVVGGQSVNIYLYQYKP